MSVVVLGSINMDVVLTVADLPKPGETVTATAKALYPGGKGANQAVAASRAGAPTQILAAVGEDRFGKDLLQNLADCGVGTDEVKTLSGTDTGQAYINVSEAGDNSIVIVSGANQAYIHPKKESKCVRQASVRLAQLEMPVDAIRSFFSGVYNAAEVTCILNAAPALPDARGLFFFADIIVINETELEVFSGRMFDDSSSQNDLVAAARTLVARAGQHVVITLGAKGCLMVGIDDVLAAEGYPACVVDTTGAGDCFCGVLAASLSSGETLEKAVLFANAAASLAVSKKGAGPSMPTRDEILEKMTANKSGVSGKVMAAQ